MAKRNKIILLIAAFGFFIAIMLYTSTSPQKTVDNIKRGYSGIVISKQQTAYAKEHYHSHPRYLPPGFDINTPSKADIDNAFNTNIDRFIINKNGTIQYSRYDSRFDKK